MDYRVNNIKTELYKKIEALPKIELHRHLEGSLRLGTMSEIAREYRLDLPGYGVEDIRPLVQIMPNDEPNSSVYLSKFATLRHFYRSPEIIDRVAYEAVADAASENIVYFEMRFTPVALARAQDFPLADVTDWVIAAVERARRDFGIDVRLIIMPNRHEGFELAEEMIDLAVERMDRGVVGVDLGGDEAEYPGEEFATLYHKAREAGLAVTIHAGEWAGPESIRLAIGKLGATRLGHGVRVVEDSNVLQLARERRVTFEVCPTSNVQSGVAPNFGQHPLRDMYEVGLLTTLNTDSTSVGGISLTDEYVNAVEYMGFSMGDIKQLVFNAARAAFLPDDERAQLIDHLQAEFASSTVQELKP